MRNLATNQDAQLDINLKIYQCIYKFDVGIAKAYTAGDGEVTLRTLSNDQCVDSDLFDVVVIHPPKSEQLTREEFANDLYSDDLGFGKEAKASIVKNLIQIDGVLVAQMNIADVFTSSLDLVNKLEDRIIEGGVSSQDYLKVLSNKTSEPHRASAQLRSEACLDVYLMSGYGEKNK